MDWIFILFVGLLAIALALAIGLVIDRERQLDAARDAVIRGETGAAAASVGDDLPTLVRRLRERLDASEFELEQQVRNASHLADVMGVGILRLDDRRRVDQANAAAHVLLRRSPGSIVGLTAIETFVDSRVEDLIATARETGSVSGEFRLSGAEGPILLIRARRSPVSGATHLLADVRQGRRPQPLRAALLHHQQHRR